MISIVRQNSGQVRMNRRLVPLTAVLCLLVLLAGGSAFSSMDLMDEDSLSDIQAQTGLSLVAKVRTTAGNMRITGTGYIDLDGVTINNSGTGYGRIGDFDDPATLDVGKDGGTAVRMRLTFPNGMNGATELNEVPSIQAATVNWTNAAGTPVNIGSLSINQIYQNNMRWTAWFHDNGGMNLLMELNGDITNTQIDPPGDGSGGGVSLQNMLFSQYGDGNNTAPGRAAGYFNFGGASSMVIDIYTAEKVWAAGEQGFFTDPGTADGRNRTLMRITYPVTGSVRIGNGRIQDAVTDAWNNYGPIIMENMTGGEITIEFPHSVGTGVIYFNPDV